MTSIARPHSPGSFLRALAIQSRVIGALILRELHTRYGRENIGYLWMVGEPMMLASVIGFLHLESGHDVYGSDIRPLPFAIVGYCTFIVFRGIVNRAEGGVESGASLLYHKQVTPLDIVFSRALLVIAGVFGTFCILMALSIAVGLASFPYRPLELLVAWGLMFWYSVSQALIIAAVSYENRTFGRFVHPYTYFMVGLSGAFTPLGDLPPTFRTILSYIPLTAIFELARYGQFQSSTLEFFYGGYLVWACVFLTLIGLILLRAMRSRVHLS